MYSSMSFFTTVIRPAWLANKTNPPAVLMNSSLAWCRQSFAPCDSRKGLGVNSLSILSRLLLPITFFL